MRSLLMASAALILSTGLAMAQTSTSAPAPTGAPNAPAAAPGASPGNMAPAPSASGQGAMAPSANSASASAGSSSTASSAPAPTGAANAAPAMPGGAPGNMAPSKSASSSTSQMLGAASSGPTATAGTAPAAPVVHDHHAMGMAMATLPANASAGTYLHIAKTAIRKHEMARADDALSHAETRMLTRAVPASATVMADNSPGVTAIENARSALHGGNYAEAASDVETAMQNLHGRMGDHGTMGGGSAVMGNGATDTGAQGTGIGSAAP